jgi:hypothetical protein
MEPVENWLSDLGLREREKGGKNKVCLVSNRS